MAAPESINVLYHFPAFTFIVGQSIMHDTVTACSTGSRGGPPHSWSTLLREGSISLNVPLNCWNHHQSCSSWTEGHEW